MGSPVTHFEILGTDPEELYRFYQQVFGWGLKHPPGDGYAMVTTNSGDASIEGGIGRAEAGGRSVKFYVSVEDLEATLAQIESGGGRVVLTPRQVEEGGVHIALFSDPEGNVLGLVRA